MGEPNGAERYLRRLGERMVLEGPEPGPFPGTVERVADALVAVGALEPTTAESVTDDYVLAGALRGQGGRRFQMHHRRQAATGTPIRLTPSRVVPGPVTVSVPWGEVTVRWVRFGADGTDIAVFGRVEGRGARHSTAAPHPLPTPQVADDRGTTTTADFNGQHGPELVGKFTTGSPLAADSAWLELTGSRIDLPVADVRAAEVHVETLPRRPPAFAHLWHEMAVSDMRFRRSDQGNAASVDALVALGVIEPDDPELAVLRQVGEGTRVAGSLPPGLPPLWESLLKQPPPPPAGDVTGVVPVGVVAGPVDGAVVAIDAIEVRPEELSMEVLVSPAAALHHHFDGSARRALEWWVEDDRGEVRLGRVGESGGTAEKRRATIEFSPGLRRDVRELRVVLVGATERAVVTVAVPWAPESHGAGQP
jgi:hypothetical protein